MSDIIFSDNILINLIFFYKRINFISKITFGNFIMWQKFRIMTMYSFAYIIYKYNLSNPFNSLSKSFSEFFY